jgi:glycosyltransferase involved in cell wall biosynthesis
MMLALYTLMYGSTTLGVLLLTLTIHRTRQFTRKHIPASNVSLNDLPTVSVCIPARNETHAMTQCLERVIASKYEKLEIIVFDDQSGDDTSILIKSFAHAGVRFVEGTPLPEGWLGKNHALHELYREASGEYILFMDVDTLLSTQSIDSLIALMLREHAEVISVLPTRDDAWRASVYFAPLRFFWTLIGHTKQYPAAASSALFVRRSLLKELYDGFYSLRMAVQPEQIIAADAAALHHYRFFISTKALGVSYEKKWRSQVETSIRLLYPTFGASFVGVLFGFILLLALIAPFAVVLSSIATGWYAVHTLAAIALACIGLSYTVYTARIWKYGWATAWIIFPFIAVQEAILLIGSAFAYATKSVTWKGRPITLPSRGSRVKE